MFFNKSIVEIIQLISLLTGTIFILIGLLSLLIVLPFFSSYVVVSLFICGMGVIIGCAGKLVYIISEIIDDILY